MLQNLSLRNFRAFRYQRFDFSRINIFVGPNNSGKSSALSAINLLAQTTSTSDPSSPLLLTGQYEDLGTFIDVVHGHRSNTPLGIEFTIDDYSYRIEFKYRKQRREIELSSFELARSNKRLFSYTTRKDAYDIMFLSRKFETLLPNIAKRRPRFFGFMPVDRNIRGAFFSSRSRHARDRYKDISKSTAENLSRVDNGLFLARRRLQNEFLRFDALGSFRDPPQRTYLYTGVIPSNVGRTGSNSVNILVGDTAKRGVLRLGLVEKVSAWFKSTGMARGVKVKPLTSRHFEICVIGNDGNDYNICDVGFGCSQVLPVLVGGLNVTLEKRELGPTRAAPTYVVQEPEIHLHPSGQAELATFFVDLAKHGAQLFIETHSDNLVLRLQRHIANRDISAVDVRVFYFKDQRGVKEVTLLDLDEDGIFKEKWPDGFFPQRQIESLALAQAPVKRASTKKTV